MSLVAYIGCTRADVAGARWLARDLKRRRPEWRIAALWVDGEDNVSSWRADFDFVIEAEALYGDGWRRFVFCHDAREAVAAAKARAALRLMDEGAERVLYFSPEIAVFDDLAPLAAELDEASLVLTPHLLAPESTAQAIADNEGLARRCGVFNLDFLGLRNDAEGRRIADWWRERVEAACYLDPAAGLYLDQPYFDLAPALFEGVAIARDPGCNVASWNLSRRRLAFAADGRLLVNGEHALKFYNFSAAHDEGGLMTERYAGRRLAPYELLSWRRRALATLVAPEPRGWAYGVYDDGAVVPQGARRLYRDDPELQARFPDPFAAGKDSLRDYLQATRPDLG